MLSDIRDTLFHAKLCYELWRMLTDDGIRQEMGLGILNRYSMVFRAIRPALYISFVIKLASLFDERKDSISIDRLNKALVSNEYGELWNEGRTLYKYRSKMIAHRNKTMDWGEIAKGTGFSYKDLEMLLLQTCEMFNVIAKLQNQEPIPPLSCKHDFKRLVKDIKTGLKLIPE